MKTVTLHPDAAKNFDAKTAELVAELVELQGRWWSPFGPSSYSPDTHAHVVEVDGEKGTYNIGTPPVFNEAKELVGLGLFMHEGTLWGMPESSLDKYKKLMASLRKTNSLSNFVSSGFISQVLHNWLEEQHTGKISSPFTDYLLTRCDQSIEEIEFWIPIAETHIQNNLQFGKVTIKPIPRQFFDEWETNAQQNLPEEQRQDASTLLQRKRLRWQGLAACTIKIMAEPEQAEEKAFQAALEAVNFLRLFSPANTVPTLRSHTDLLGREHMLSCDYFGFHSDSRFFFKARAEPEELERWVIYDTDLRQMKPAGLDALDDLLKAEKRSQFQQEVFDALTLYSQSSLKIELADKLIYILVPLESILLVDAQEPITANLSDRMAMLVGRNLQERLEIRDNVKKVYGMRSRFVHHGQTIKPEDEATLRAFMITAWRCFMSLAKNASRFQNKIKFAKELDNMKFEHPTDAV